MKLTFTESANSLQTAYTNQSTENTHGSLTCINLISVICL